MTEKIAQIKGAIVDSSDEAVIFEGFPFFFYESKKVVLSDKEKALLEAVLEFLQFKKSSGFSFSIKDFSLPPGFLPAFKQKVFEKFFLKVEESKLLSFQEIDEIRFEIKKLITTFFPGFENAGFIANQALDRFLGYGPLGVLLRDRQLEEIMINGPGIPIFVFHRVYGMCKTDVLLSENELSFLIQKIALTSGKKFGEQNPFLDSSLAGGDRANATFSNVTPFGSTLTIRKFTPTPISIIGLVTNRTLSVDVAAFLWMMVEGMNVKPMNIIITGGSGSGKTTTLNALTTFIRHSDRVITIEDAVELDLGSRENWVRMETKPRVIGTTEIAMDDCLRNSLRMRPDRIILGEVRGPEAQTLFVAMDTGHEGIMGTLHANSAKEAIIRLTSDPMNVSEPMLSLLDLIIVQTRMHVHGKGIIRRFMQVGEVSSLDKKALVSNVYEFEREADEIKKTDVPSRLIEDLAQKTQMTKKEIMREILVRKKILEYMQKNKITENHEVETVIQKYYYDPQSVLETVLKELPEQ